MNEQRVRELRQLNSTPKQRKACSQKRKFPSKRNAAARARLIGGGMGEYKCVLCKGWHIGHSASRSV